MPTNVIFHVSPIDAKVYIDGVFYPKNYGVEVKVTLEPGNYLIRLELEPDYTPQEFTLSISEEAEWRYIIKSLTPVFSILECASCTTEEKGIAVGEECNIKLNIKNNHPEKEKEGYGRISLNDKEIKDFNIPLIKPGAQRALDVLFNIPEVPWGGIYNVLIGLGIENLVEYKKVPVNIIGLPPQPPDFKIANWSSECVPDGDTPDYAVRVPVGKETWATLTIENKSITEGTGSGYVVFDSKRIHGFDIPLIKPKTKKEVKVSFTSPSITYGGEHRVEVFVTPIDFKEYGDSISFPVFVSGAKPNPPTFLDVEVENDYGLWYIGLQWATQHKEHEEILGFNRNLHGNNVFMNDGLFSQKIYKDPRQGPWETIEELEPGTYTFYVTVFDLVTGEESKPTDTIKVTASDEKPVIHPPAPTPPLEPTKRCEVYKTLLECEAHGCYWYDGKCHVKPRVLPYSCEVRSEKWRPVPPGVEISNEKVVKAGTFGAVVLKDGEPFILSNYHVLAVKANIGDAILQAGEKIGTLERYIKPKSYPTPNSVDCAIAKPSTEVVSGIITECNKHVYEPCIIPTGIMGPYVGQQVKKSGSRTGLTTGEITSTDTTAVIELPYIGKHLYENMIVTQAMSKGGDSGSLLMDKGSNRAVGLLVGGSDTNSVYCKITTVLNALGVTLCTHELEEKRKVTIQSMPQKAKIFVDGKAID